MSYTRVAFLLPFALAFSGAAFAQTSPPACGTTEALKAQSSQPSEQTMAGTSSDMGNAGAGASSSALGTGAVDKTGVNSPCTPSTNGHGETGATPTTPGSNAQTP